MALPLPKATWTVAVVAGVNDRIDFKIGASTYVATIAPGSYDHFFPYLGQASLSVLDAVGTALTAAAANAWSVPGAATTQAITARVQVSGSAAFQFLFGSGADIARSAAALLGFQAADTVSATTLTAPLQHAGAWCAADPAVDDTGDLPEYERAGARAFSGRFKGLDFATRYRREVKLGFLPASKTWKADEGAGHANEAIERLFDGGWARLRWWPDATATDVFGDYALDEKTRKALERARLSAGNPVYSLTLGLLKIV